MLVARKLMYSRSMIREKRNTDCQLEGAVNGRIITMQLEFSLAEASLRCRSSANHN